MEVFNKLLQGGFLFTFPPKVLKQRKITRVQGKATYTLLELVTSRYRHGIPSFMYF